MTTDWKALCAELVDIATAHCNPDDFAVSYCAAVLLRARTALSQPEPEGPTGEELEDIARAAEIQHMKEHRGLTASNPDGIHAQLRAQRIAGLRAVAARWGRAAIKPVPVSERPWEREGWCDNNGWCWCFDADGTDEHWSFDRPEAWVCCTHVLPHYALPIPEPTTTEDNQ